MSDDLEKIYKKYFDDTGNMKPKGQKIMGEGLKGLKTSPVQTITEKGAFLPKKAMSTASKALKASKYGKIAAGVAGAGLALKEYLKSKMNKAEDVDKKSMGGDMKKGYGQARTSGMGLQDENVTLGKGSDYIKDLL